MGLNVWSHTFANSLEIVSSINRCWSQQFPVRLEPGILSRTNQLPPPRNLLHINPNHGVGFPQAKKGSQRSFGAGVSVINPYQTCIFGTSPVLGGDPFS